MHKTNWIILASKDRGIDYGVGTFIKQLSKGLVGRKEINVFILEIGITGNNSFSVRREKEITILEIPLKENTMGIDSKKNQEKLSRNITRVVGQYIPKCNDTVIHLNYIFQYFIASELKKALNGKVIFTQHILVRDEYLKSNCVDTEELTCNLVDKIITVTNQGKEYLVEKWGNADKTKVVYNGIDPKYFTEPDQGAVIREKYGIKNNVKIVLYTGRLDAGKGLTYLFKSFGLLLKKLPECCLVLAGDGNINELVKLSKSFSSQINYLGFVPFADLISLYSEADIGVIPSLQEQCSYVALEMLFCGLPVVASNIGGLKEIFIHEENALLVNTVIDKTNSYGVAPDFEQLTNHMCKLLSDENLRNDFSENSRVRAKKQFTLDTMINNYIQTIKT